MAKLICSSIPSNTDGFGPIRQQNVYTNTQEPLLPYRLANFVLAILGLTNYTPMVDQVAKPLTDFSAPQSGSSNACRADFGLPNGCHLPSDFARMYDLDPLYARGDGAGQTLGIVTLAAVDPGAPQYFWPNIAHVTRTGTFTVDNVDGGAPEPRRGLRRDRPGHRAVRGAGTWRRRDRPVLPAGRDGHE